MTARNFNNVTSRGTMTSPVGPGDTTILVDGFSNYPAAPFTITVERNTDVEEVMLVTAIVPGALTVTRGYDGTAAQTHLAGSFVEHTAIAIDFREANQHVVATEGVHGTTGSLVGTEGPQALFDKTLVSPLAEADATLGDAIVAYVPVGAEDKNLFRGMDPDGDDVYVVGSDGKVTATGGTAPEHLVRKSYVDAADSALQTQVTANTTAIGTKASSATVTGIDTRVTAAETTLAAATAAAASVNTLVKRNASGEIAVDAVFLTDTPSSGTMATPKTYVDGVIATQQARTKAVAASVTTDGSGFFTVTHGFGSTPTAVICGSRLSGANGGNVISVTAITASDFTARCYYNGAPDATQTRSIYWVAFA